MNNNYFQRQVDNLKIIDITKVDSEKDEVRFHFDKFGTRKLSSSFFSTKNFKSLVGKTIPVITDGKQVRSLSANHLPIIDLNIIPFYKDGSKNKAIKFGLYRDNKLLNEKFEVNIQPEQSEFKSILEKVDFLEKTVANLLAAVSNNVKSSYITAEANVTNQLSSKSVLTDLKFVHVNSSDEEYDVKDIDIYYKNVLISDIDVKHTAKYKNAKRIYSRYKKPKSNYLCGVNKNMEIYGFVLDIDFELNCTEESYKEEGKDKIRYYIDISDDKQNVVIKNIDEFMKIFSNHNFCNLLASNSCK